MTGLHHVITIPGLSQHMTRVESEDRLHRHPHTCIRVALSFLGGKPQIFENAEHLD
jgi:hypothetical protein